MSDDYYNGLQAKASEAAYQLAGLRYLLANFRDDEEVMELKNAHYGVSMIIGQIQKQVEEISRALDSATRKKDKT
jgi:hypothetical protein